VTPLLKFRGKVSEAICHRKNFHMTSNTLPQKNHEIKHVGPAIECGTLTILLNAVSSHPILAMPLQRVVPHGAQLMRQWAVHLTAPPVFRYGAIYYATFFAAEALGIGKHFGLISPYRFHDPTTLLRGNALQKELTQCICQVIAASQYRNDIIVPARYRLLDEWTWSARSTAEQILFHEEHWILAEDKRD
jgi:hypothetical protein